MGPPDGCALVIPSTSLLAATPRQGSMALLGARSRVSPRAPRGGGKGPGKTHVGAGAWQCRVRSFHSMEPRAPLLPTP